MKALLYDLRHAVRALRRGPGFTATVLVTLGLGIGVAVAAFSVVRGVLLQPLPYPAAERLVVVWETDADDDSFAELASGPDFADFVAQARSFDALASASFPEVNLRPAVGPPQRIEGNAVSAAWLPLFGARPALGRLLTAADDAAGAPRVVVLGHTLWQGAFGGDPDIIGRRIVIDAGPAEVVGVLTADFGLPGDEPQLWMALTPNLPFVDLRGVHNLYLVGRLREGVTLKAAQAEMSGIAAALATAYPDDNVGRGVRLEPLHEATVGSVRRELWILAGVVALVLAIVIANVGGLWLVRAHGRRRELAVRAALGASRQRLATQMLVESALAGLASAALGLLVAPFALRGFLALRPNDLPRAGAVEIDGAALAFAAGIALLVTLLCAGLPLLAGSPVAAGRLGSRGGAPAQARLRTTLVVGEIALALVLTSGTTLLGRSLWKLLAVDPGFRPGSVVSFGLELPDGRYRMPARDVYPAWPEVVAAQDRIVAEVGALPGVQGVTLALNHPLERGFTSQVEIVGRPAATGPIEETRIRPVTPGYHQMLRIPLLAGRHLTAADRAGTARVVVVNRGFAAKHFPGANPLGEQVTMWGGLQMRIVGVVGDVRFHGLAADSQPAIHAPLAQLPFAGFRLLVASSLPRATLEREVRAAVARLEPDVALHEVAPLGELLAGTYGERRFVMVLLAAFGGVALVLAAIGLYGLLSFQAAQRRRELGIRQALGAARGDLVRLMTGEGAALALAGALLGIAGSLALTRSLRGFLYEVEPLDPLALAGAVLVLAAVTLVAVWLPARRASRVDPMSVLREDAV